MNDNQQNGKAVPVDQTELDQAERKFQRAQKTVWERLAGVFTQVSYSRDHISPHAGARRKPRDWRRKRKIRKQMAAHSRKINRRQR